MVVRVTKLNGRQRRVEQRSGLPFLAGRRRGPISSKSSSAAFAVALPESPPSVDRRPRGGRLSPAQILRSACFFISITGLAANHAQLAAQEVTSVAPPTAAVENALPDAPGAAQYPDAVPIPGAATDVSIVSDTQSRTGSLSTLDGSVVITYRNRVLRADHIVYNSDTGDADMTGHVVVTIEDTAERVEASHGTININTQTGRFFDVVGSVGAARKTAAAVGPTLSAAKTAAANQRYSNGNPFLFTGRMVVKTGPRQYTIYDGTITSCQLPDPDWLLSAKKFDVNGTKASTANSIFHLIGLPLLWLPYVTHPTDANERQSGFLIPEFGLNSASYGDTVGEQLYWVINRSADLTVGTLYYSARGWKQTASLHYRGLGQDFVTARYSGLHDRGYYPGGVYVNQSGTDVTFSGRYDLIAADESAGNGAAPAAGSPVQERAVTDVEYLSSFPYREAFTADFNQAVSSDVISTIYLAREQAAWRLRWRATATRVRSASRAPTPSPAQSRPRSRCTSSMRLRWSSPPPTINWVRRVWSGTWTARRRR